MDEEKYKTLKQIACGVLFTAAAAAGALYVYSVVKENPKGIYQRVQHDASGIAKDNSAWFCERMNGDYEAAKGLAKDPIGAVKGDIKALDEAVNSK